MGVKYKKFQPTEYVIKIRKGKIVKKGLGLSFFYNTMSTSMMVVPATAFDLAFTFDDIMTADFQHINVQGDISYSINDYEKAAKLVDFSYTNDKTYAKKLLEAKQAISKRIINLAKISISKYISDKDVRTAIKSGMNLATFIRESMREDETIKEFGLNILSVSILGVSPQLDTKKALEAATREEILKQQDDARYKRRNAAIEQERIVKENELNTEIRVAEKEKEKREKEMETKRLIQERQAELDKKKLSDDIYLEEEKCRLVDLETENEKKKADAKAYENKVIMATFAEVDTEVLKALAISGMDSKTLIAKAFTEIGDKADKIGVLNVTPDLLETLTKE